MDIYYYHCLIELLLANMRQRIFSTTFETWLRNPAGIIGYPLGFKHATPEADFT